MTICVSLDADKMRLDTWNNATHYVALITSALFTASGVTFTNGSPNIDVSGHDLVVGCQIKFSTTGTLPGSVNSATTYWVVSVATNTIQVSLTKDGTPITHTGSGTGTHSVLEQEPIVTTSNGRSAMQIPTAALVRHEVSSYNSSARQLLPTIPGAVIDYATNQVSTVPATDVTVTFATAAPVTYRYVAVIRDGTATRGDATGTVVALYKLANDTSTGASQTIGFDVANFV